MRLQSAEGGRCNDQFARSSKIAKARRVVKQTQNRTETCLCPIRNTPQYIPISKITPKWTFSAKKSVNITSLTLYFPQGRRFLPRLANRLPGVIYIASCLFERARTPSMPKWHVNIIIGIYITFLKFLLAKNVSTPSRQLSQWLIQHTTHGMNVWP